ncbi:LytR/AlgR family response regulator transcription factor [Alkalitalea saponilacus]|uniref:Two component transcriptional regulator, LytTR family n=1 Tax=Alkalitalea saponilacus TaxID=889453 RepID=A0A1T5F810_9BACT|nr:response regulator [Alkalitalea saponilacus]ASB50143.1 DNA-binding response regulator [Alkalitalea saponilacus]SKB92305.1 two component transcriptional regulator, LytTR family [Alkalitalea saponilacus]
MSATTETIKTCIIDDELPARDNLKAMLNALCPNIEIVGEAESVLTGLKCIRTHRPQLIFLDVQMTDGTGFDLLNRLEFDNFNLIFLTAHDEYAIKAFRYSAIDYLLKPLDPDDLINSVKKVEKHIQHINKEKDIQYDNIANGKRIILKTSDNIYIVNIDEIIRCEANCNYTTFFLHGNQKIMVSKTLKEQETILLPHGFFRTHQSHLVNLQQIVRINKSDGNSVVMSDNSHVPVSSRKKDDLIHKIESL